MDPRIILAGQQPDFVNILAQSNSAAQQKIQYGRENALADFTQANGPAMVRGDANALANYGAFDPAGAMAMQAQQQRMGMLSREEERDVADRASAMSAAERAAAAAGVEDAVKMGLMIPDAATWDAQMAQSSPELVGQFANRDSLAAKYMSMADVLKRMDGPDLNLPSGFMANPNQPGAAMRIPGTEPPVTDPLAALKARAGEAGYRPGTPEYAQFMALNGKQPEGTVIESDGQGGMRIVTGPGAGAAAARPFTEGQSKDVVYSTRARGALAALEPVAGALTDRMARASEYDPTGLARGALQSDNFQVALNAGNEFLQAILRKDTGAAITEGEQALYGVTYLPQPGDNPALLAQKVAARQRAIAAIEGGMSPSQMVAQEKALSSGNTGAPEPVPNQSADALDFSNMSQAELSMVDVNSLSSEQMDAMMNRFKEVNQ